MILLCGARFCFSNPWSWLILEDIGNVPQTEWTSDRRRSCLLIFARTSSRSYGVFVSYKTWSCLMFWCSSLDLALTNFSVLWLFLLDLVALDLVSYVPPRRDVPVGPLPSAKANWVCPFCPHIWPSSRLDFHIPGHGGMDVSWTYPSLMEFAWNSPREWLEMAIGKGGKAALLQFNLRTGCTGPQLLLSPLNHPENTVLSGEGEDI